MDGLGYNIIKVGVNPSVVNDQTVYEYYEYHYDCNYKGYHFTLLAEAIDYEIKERTFDEWEESDGNGTGIGDPYTATEYYPEVKVPANSIGKIMSYFNITVKQSVEYKTWCAESNGSTLEDCEFYGEEEDIKEEYSQYDWENEVDENGMPIPTSEVIGKTIKTIPSGLMVIN